MQELTDIPSRFHHEACSIIERERLLQEKSKEYSMLEMQLEIDKFDLDNKLAKESNSRKFLVKMRDGTYYLYEVNNKSVFNQQ